MRSLIVFVQNNDLKCNIYHKIVNLGLDVIFFFDMKLSRDMMLLKDLHLASPARLTVKYAEPNLSLAKKTISTNEYFCNAFSREKKRKNGFDKMRLSAHTD